MKAEKLNFFLHRSSFQIHGLQGSQKILSNSSVEQKNPIKFKGIYQLNSKGFFSMFRFGNFILTMFFIHSKTIFEDLFN